MTTDPTSLAAVLEPTAVDRAYAYDAVPGAADLVQTSQAISLRRIADTLDKIERHLAPIVIDAANARPDPMERLADAADNLAALLAAGPALAATGFSPPAAQPGALKVGDRVRDKVLRNCFGRVHAIDGFKAQIFWEDEDTVEGNKFWPWSDFEVVE